MPRLRELSRSPARRGDQRDKEQEEEEVCIVPDEVADEDPDEVAEPPCLPSHGAAVIPFAAVFHMLPFRSPERRVFLPGVPVEVRLAAVERFTSSYKMLIPNVYNIELRHGEFRWRIKRRFRHFLTLQQELLKFYTLLKIPLPTKTHVELRRSVKGQQKQVPALPRRPDFMAMEDHVSTSKEHLQEFLTNLLKRPIYMNHLATMEFLEVSELSFVRDLGSKGLEGTVVKRSGGHWIPGLHCCGYHKACYRWARRWLVVKDSFVLYQRPEDGSVASVLLYDRGFCVKSSAGDTGVRHGLVLQNLSRSLTVQFSTLRQASSWGHSIREFALKHGEDFLRRNRFESFAPVREGTLANWFVNADGYFDAVALALEAATEEIFICDWWLSPEIFLRRPVVDGNTWRLDCILKRKAEQGVRVFVLLYKEVELALGLNSGYTKKTLMDLHPNIKVMRHPDHMSSTVLFWAHHEKLVVVDQSLALLGGIDLAYGRWDDAEHRLTDTGGVTRGRSWRDGALATEVTLHDGAECVPARSLEGAPHRVPSSPASSAIPTRAPVAEASPSAPPGGAGPSGPLGALPPSLTRVLRGRGRGRLGESADGGADARSERSCASGTSDLCSEVRFWHGKDYCNFILKDWVQLDKPFVDFIDRRTTPRMPWHDAGVAVHGAAARDVARHFIQRWNFTKIVKKKKKSKRNSFPFLLPKSQRTAQHLHYSLPGSVATNVQVLRSVSHWSAGITSHEESIHLAYLSAIRDSKHYIYIENQFFISCADNKTVFNKVGDALVDRILQAYRENHTFRVFVVLPLLPGFEGDITTGGGKAIQAVMHFNYRTMCRGEYSIIERLKAEMGERWMHFVSFCGLRTHAQLCGRLVTELVYVHSKMLIADDNTVIIGSANINDRSLLGRRDSEMAVVVQDTELVPSTMGGRPYRAGRFALHLRLHCFRMVLGLRDDATIDLGDPVCDRFFKEVWVTTAARNAVVYDKVFRCLPTDEVRSERELSEHQASPGLASADPRLAADEIRKVRGFLVQFPLHFLADENLYPSLNSKEGMLPSELWT